MLNANALVQEALLICISAAFSKHVYFAYLTLTMSSEQSPSGTAALYRNSIWFGMFTRLCWLQTELMRVDIETMSELSAGQTVCDVWHQSTKPKNVLVAQVTCASLLIPVQTVHE